MRATSFTHVSVHAHDLEESARFYKEVFGMQEIPSPEFSDRTRVVEYAKPAPVERCERGDP